MEQARKDAIVIVALVLESVVFFSIGLVVAVGASVLDLLGGDAPTALALVGCRRARPSRRGPAGRRASHRFSRIGGRVEAARHRARMSLPIGRLERDRRDHRVFVNVRRCLLGPRGRRGDRSNPVPRCRVARSSTDDRRHRPRTSRVSRGSTTGTFRSRSNGRATEGSAPSISRARRWPSKIPDASSPERSAKQDLVVRVHHAPFFRRTAAIAQCFVPDSPSGE
jgi:hypothetical protein